MIMIGVSGWMMFLQLTRGQTAVVKRLLLFHCKPTCPSHHTLGCPHIQKIFKETSSSLFALWIFSSNSKRHRTFRTDKAPADVDARVVSSFRLEVGRKVPTADDVKTAEMNAAGRDAQVVGMIRRGTAHALVHATCTSHSSRRRTWRTKNTASPHKMAATLSRTHRQNDTGTTDGSTAVPLHLPHLSPTWWL